MAVIDIEKLSKAIPESEQDIKRFKFLKEDAKDIRIAIFGKYNHGKSTLLNTIIGKDIFKASDKRETIKNQEYKHDNIVWIDTPGLDADVTGKDDKEAKECAFTTADVLFLVHNIKAGELDKYETEYYKDLMRRKKNYREKMFLILTQIDQVDHEQLNQVVYSIKKQLPELTTFPVSSIRYKKGINENKPFFVESSGMKDMFQLIGRLINEIKNLREVEINSLSNKLKKELDKKRNHVDRTLVIARDKVQDNKDRFSADVTTYLKNVKMKA